MLGLGPQKPREVGKLASGYLHWRRKSQPPQLALCLSTIAWQGLERALHLPLPICPREAVAQKAILGEGRVPTTLSSILNPSRGEAGRAQDFALCWTLGISFSPHPATSTALVPERALQEAVGYSVLCEPTSPHKDALLLGISQPPTSSSNCKEPCGPTPVFSPQTQRGKLN